MRPEELLEMRELEDHYWWFVSRRRTVLRLLDRLDLGPYAELLDGGCGTGALLVELGSRGHAHGADVSRDALRLTAQRGAGRLVCSDLQQLAFRDGSFHVLLSADVLEHVEDDQRALAELGRVAKVGGHIIITVPALDILWGPHDEALRHRRRYSPRRLRALARGAGLEVKVLSYGLVLLFPLALLLRSAQRLSHRLRPRAPTTGIVALPPWANRLASWLMAQEERLVGRVPLPWGVSLVAVLRKPGRPMV